MRLASLLRWMLTMLAMLALCSASRLAHAQLARVPGSELYCTPDAPCPLAPPVPPPAYSPALAAQTEARHEADARTALEPSLRDGIALEVDEKRRRAWIERGRIRERDPVPLGYPIVQAVALGGVTGAATGEKNAREGVLVVRGSMAGRFMPNRLLAFELGGGVTTAATTGPADRYRSVHIEPAFLVCGCGDGETVHTVLPWLRGAVDIGLPFDGGSKTPDVLVAFKVGFEVDLLVARFGDGGFAGAVIQASGVLRLAAGGETSVLRKVTGGIELLVGPTLAF